MRGADARPNARKHGDLAVFHKPDALPDGLQGQAGQACDHLAANSAAPAISTWYAGAESRASTVARAGASLAITEASHVEAERRV